MPAATLNILSRSEFFGSLKFVGDPGAGPAGTMILTRVQLAPSGATGWITEEWGTIEVEGEVLSVAGDPFPFGSYDHPDDGLVSPDTDAYYLGAGVVSWQPEGETGYRHVGNVTVFETEPQVERLPHFQRMAGLRSKDLSVVTTVGLLVRFTMEEYTLENLRFALLADVAAP